MGTTERFAFGQNWKKYLSLVDDGRIARAERSLVAMLGQEDFRDCRFLDVGSGSGPFSLAARRLGADVVSFDYDPDSVSCTCRLRADNCGDEPRWTVHQGSVLDRGFLASLGQFDLV